MTQKKSAYEDEFDGMRGEYEYYALNEFYGGFRTLNKGKMIDVLGYGAAEGAELEPIIDQADRVCIVDPTKKM